MKAMKIFRELEQQQLVHTCNRMKLVEIFKNLHSMELKIYSEAAKEFIKLLKEDPSGDFLHEYIKLSPKISELLESWRLHQGKSGLASIISVFTAIFEHPAGKIQSSEISRSIYHLAYSIFKEKTDDIYAELTSKEYRRQNAALLLLASIAKRGIGIASQVAESFLDEGSHKITTLAKLAGTKKYNSKEEVKCQTRRAFIKFAMSFVEAGNSKLLIKILQHKDLYSGVFRNISDDDPECIEYILSTLKNKVLTADSGIPPWLRSSLFGSITLEQLSFISGNSMMGSVAKLAHQILVMVCTDPSNGLMPGLNLKGNEKRLFEFMKKLEAADCAFHKELLLEIVRTRTPFCAAYMNEFPYNLQIHSLSLLKDNPQLALSWFSAISLAADMISTVNFDSLITSTTPNSSDELLGIILKCIIPRQLSKSVINNGLQHADERIKHGTLRIVLEALKSLAGLLVSIDNTVDSITCKNDHMVVKEVTSVVIDPLLEHEICFSNDEIKCSNSSKSEVQKWVSLKELIQDEVRVMLPDPQVLLKLLSSSGIKKSTLISTSLKRCAYSLSKNGSKKLKTVDTHEDIVTNLGGFDIEVANVSLKDLEDVNVIEEFDGEKDDIVVIAEIWGLSKQGIVSDGHYSKENFFQAKLLDTLKFYLRTVPLAIEGSFDFFKILPQDPSTMSAEQIQSLLSLLLEHIHQAPSSQISAKPPKFMYKHLQRLINIYISSNMKCYQGHAYTLVRTAMISTGAFDQNISEIDAWLFTLTGYCMNICSTDNMEEETFQEMTSIVSLFLCDSVSTVGNSLYKYIAQMQDLISNVKNINDGSPGFSPLIICVLEKCHRLLESESKTYKLFDKSMISLYTCNAISLILQTQVEARLLSGLILLILEEKLNEHVEEGENSIISLCEWRPMMNLLYFAKLIFYQNSCNFSPYSASNIMQGDSSLYLVLVKIEELLKTENNVKLVGVAAAFSSLIISVKPNDVLMNLPQLLTITERNLKSYFPFLSWVLLLEQGFLANVAHLWSDMFSSALNNMEGVISNSEIDHQYSPETASLTAFQLFLNNTPFRALFTSIMAVENLKTVSRESLAVLHSKEMVSLLQFKLSQGTPDDLFVSLRIVLFWTSRTMMNCRTHASDALEERFRICITLVEYLLCHISVANGGITQCIQDIIDLIFKHPVIILSLSTPFYFSELKDNTHDFLISLGDFHLIDHDNFQLLSIVFNFAITAGKQCPTLILNPVQKSIDEFVENIKISIMNRNEELLPRLYLLTKLLQFISPFVLLNLVELIFDQFETSTTESTSSFTKAVSIGLYIMDSALGMLLSYLQHQNVDSTTNLLWRERARNVDTSILMKIYHKILDSKSLFESERADACLLKLVTAVYDHRFAKEHPTLVPLCTQMSRMMAISPMKMLLHCIYPTSKTKGKLLSCLTKISSVHMKLFGKIFTGILNKNFSGFDLLNKDGFSEQNYLLLLPTAWSYLMFNVNKYGEKHVKPVQKIAKFYFTMLLGCFSNWEDFISQEIFQDEDTELFPEDFHKHCSNTLLGKVVTMFSYSLTLIGYQKKQKQLLRVFDSLCSDYIFFGQHDSLSEPCSCTYKESLKIVKNIVAKVSLTRSLLFPPVSLELKSDEQSRAFDNANKFMCILINTLDHIITKLPSQFESAICYPVFKFLEHYILNNIVQLCLDTQSSLKESPSTPILDNFFSSSLHHRLEDPFTLKAVRCILVTLSESITSAKIFDLLVKHPKFGPLISKCCIDIDSSTFMQPQSILTSLDLSTVLKNDREIESGQFCFRDTKLELIRLLRVLYQFKGLQQYTGSPELLSLLMCGYSATMSETDMEIFQLMNEIETIEGFCIADMDFVWGGSALKIKNGLAAEEISSANMGDDTELILQKHRMLFRENIPVVPMLSVMTVLHFCNDRASLYDSVSVKRLLEDSKFADRSEKISSLHVSVSQVYDPVYIMRFSNHCLSMGYFEPTEFSKLGLLAVAFASISSPDEEVQKLGYICLEKFRNHLDTKISMNYEKKKDALQLQLLLTYIQNGITEKWQRIPYVAAVFAAEASLVLLDQSNNHFSNISKFLKNSYRMNLKAIPLFPELLKTSSLKADHLWILKLLYAGLNSDIDAEIYKKQEVPKLLLSFSASSLCDDESKILILQIMKKCVKHPMLALSTIKKHGLISWLSSTLFFNTKRLPGDHNEVSLELIELTMKVIYDSISSPSINHWLQVDAFEQLSSLSSQLHMLAVSSSGLLKGNGSLVNSLLSIILSTLKMSHYRKSNQSHFTLSLLGLFRLYRVIDIEFSGLNINSISTIELDIILMSTPAPAVTPMHRVYLAELLTRAIPAALKSFHMQTTMADDSDFLTGYNRQEEDNIYISKLLRWVSASVILGSINSKDSKLCRTSSTKESKMETIQSILEVLSDEEREGVKKYSNSSEALAVNILYFQQLLRRDYSCLPSVILALHLLLMHDGRSKQGCENFDEFSIGLAANYSNIQSPPEIRPDWRWSYDEPWSSKEDEHMQNISTKEQMEEEQACQSALLIFYNILGGKYSSSSALSYNELESNGLFEWERNMFLETKPSKKRKQSTFD